MKRIFVLLALVFALCLPSEGTASTVFAVPWDSDFDTSIPPGLSPVYRIGVIDNDVCCAGGGSIKAADDGGYYSVESWWQDLTVLPGNEGAIGYWVRSDYLPVLEGYGTLHLVQIRPSGGLNNKIIISSDFTKNGANYDFYVSARMYNSAGVQLLPTLTGTITYSDFTDWHYIELNWLWNDGGGITEISLDGTVIQGTTNGNTETRSGGSNTPKLQLQTYESVSAEENVWMDELTVWDAQQHVGGFTPSTCAGCAGVNRRLNFGRPFGSSFGGGFGH